MNTTTEEMAAIVKRVNQMYADELTDETPDGETVEFDLFHHRAAGGIHRVRITPSELENGSWESDLGPAFTSRGELEAFLRGLEFARRIDSTAEYIDQ